ncbi:hypothetical protein yc1106_02757 [Curvularia clavata]|uniref:Uncharacterized protein n=1 Tax=Curvularia clavata TaxID=95742 RepID=A0A9Q8Z7W4_CURCL|nr:hypothetical protein yc1106_02757 [Curvularia clavata]
MPAPHPDEIRRRLQAARALDHRPSAVRSALSEHRRHILARSEDIGIPTKMFEQTLTPVDSPSIKLDPYRATHTSLQATNVSVDPGSLQYPLLPKSLQQELALPEADGPGKLSSPPQLGHVSSDHPRHLSIRSLITIVTALILCTLYSTTRFQKSTTIPDSWKAERLEGYINAVTEIDVHTLGVDIMGLVQIANSSIARAARSEHDAALHLHSSLIRPLQKADPHRGQLRALMLLAEHLQELDRRVNVTVETLDATKVLVDDALNVTQKRYDEQVTSRLLYVREAANPRKASPVLQRTEQNLEVYAMRIAELANGTRSISALSGIIHDSSREWKQYQQELQWIDQGQPTMKREKATATDQDWQDWHNSIDIEREILVIYKDAVVDMFSASPHIQWDNVVERLRDLESPLSLFDGHEALQKHVETTNIRTIPAIALIAVALNNHAVFHNQPFKFCWSNVSPSSGEESLFMTFGAWSAKETEDWKSASPGFRAKWCTVWESAIRPSSRAMRIPYTRKKTMDFLHNTVTTMDIGKLTWAESCISKRGQVHPGELVFIPGYKNNAHRGQCMTSGDLHGVLRAYFLESRSHKSWHTLKLQALTAIQNQRRSGKQHTATFWRDVRDVVAGSEKVSPMVKKPVDDQS